MSFNFVHLRVHSAYSLLEGAMRIKELVGLCAKQNMPAIAITDNGNLFGSLEFSLAAADAGIQPIIGASMNFRSVSEGESRTANRQSDQLLLYAQNEIGYRNLLALVSKSYLHPVDDTPGLLNYHDMDGFSDGLICLTGGPMGGIGRQLATGRDTMANDITLGLADLFPGRLYIELMRHGQEIERRIEPGLIALAMKHNLPLVATNDVYFPKKDMYEAHDALLCVADGSYISEKNRRRLTPEHYFKSPEEMCKLFADIPEALENTLNIARRCSYMSESRAPMLPRFEGADESELLRQHARDGLETRLKDHVFKEDMNEAAREAAAKPYRDRLEFELNVIINMQFPGYFLIVSDFITWSKLQGIPVGPGRGSGAGSVVAWSLLITDLDPLRYGLLFERFLNPERVSMPDFDIDFCQDRRDEVIRYVQQKYGAHRVAQIITFGKLQARAVLRDVGRVLQMPYGQVDRICKLVPNNPAHPVTLAEAIEMEPALKSAIREDESVQKLVDISLKLEGLNRHASTHAAGVVIGDRSLEELVPLYRDPKSDMRVVQYSMKYAELAGLVKFDFLGLKTLTVLKTTLDHVAKRGITLDLLKLPEGDPKTYAMLSQGDTTGVFQLESAGMRETLKRLKPDCLEDIIALVSLYRPGPMDNIPTYVARKHGEEKPQYLHPKLEEVLRETYGVIIYQEQVMQIAQLLAGYSLGEADLLRRAMGKKIRAEMEAQRNIFVERSVANGVAEPQAKAIFDLIAKFAEYGFNKSHAAAYAVIAYQTAYLKANYPVEFIAASMTYDMHNTDKLAIFRAEAERFGIALLPPDVNRSGATFTVETDKEGVMSIRYALAALKNVGAQAMDALMSEREANGSFESLWDFSERVDAKVLNRRQLENLIKAGAFDSLHPNRHQLFESIDIVLSYAAAATRDKESSQASLFGELPQDRARTQPILPPLDEWPPLEKLHHEFAAMGFYLSAHPLEGYKKSLERMRVTPSHLLGNKLGSSYASIKLAGIVTGKKMKVSDKGRFAFVQLSDASGMFEVAIFDETLLNKHRDSLENGMLLLIEADAKMEESGARIIAQSIGLLDELVMKHQQGNSMPEVLIHLQDNAVLPQLKQLIGAGNGQGRQVVLVTKAEGLAHTHIRLPGRYQITPATLSHIATLNGIARVEEGN